MLRYLFVRSRWKDSSSNDEQAALLVEGQPANATGGRARGFPAQSMAGCAVANADVPELPRPDRSKRKGLSSLQRNLGISRWGFGKVAAKRGTQLHADLIRAFECELRILPADIRRRAGPLHCRSGAAHLGSGLTEPGTLGCECRCIGLSGTVVA